MSAPATLQFQIKSGDDPFTQGVREAVSSAMEGHEMSYYWRMWAKALFILPWLPGSVLAAIFLPTNWWQKVFLVVILAPVSAAAVAFNIGHDANHGAFFPARMTRQYWWARWLNSLARFSFDWLGASSYLWRFKHNVMHHTNPNVLDEDSDIGQLPFLRLHPAQKRYWYMRYQSFYGWPLYGLFAVKWVLLGDHFNLIRGRIGEKHLKRPRGINLVQYISGKLLFYGWSLVLPIVFYHDSTVEILGVLGLFLGGLMVLGVILAVVFQLAHASEGPEFHTLVSSREGSSLGLQFRATQNFHCERRWINKLLAWYLGGLNRQIEHHAEHTKPHTFYSRMSEAIEPVCREHNVPYRDLTLWQALRSHGRWLRKMGRPSATSNA